TLRDPALYRVDPADAWRRLKGVERLDDAAFAAARALADWRERRAMARNLPRGWILPDAAIHELAAARPRTREALARMSEVPAGTAMRAADELLAAIAAAPGSGGEREFVDAERPGPEQLKVQKVLQARLAEIASAFGIQPEVLATRRELAALARGVRGLPVMRGWRREAVGEKLLAAL
ncbi:MAG TPA: HRDC domain-containing protein, partial [Steroidobacteraceae bacterium]|nr:HRDC domain-containing protein [Steroidobacteraceae bacterium]